MTTVTARPGNSLQAPSASPRRLARVAGLLYLSLVALGMFGPMVLESLLVPGDAAATAENATGSRGLFTVSLLAWVAVVAVDTALAVVLYALLAPVDRVHSMVAAAFRLVYSAVLGALLVHVYDASALLFSADRAAGRGPGEVETLALDALVTFDAGFLLALVVFGAHLVALGLLFLRSGYVPRVIRCSSSRPAWATPRTASRHCSATAPRPWSRSSCSHLPSSASSAPHRLAAGQGRAGRLSYDGVTRTLSGSGGRRPLPDG